MASISEILKSLTARNTEEESVLHSVIGFAHSFATRGQRDLGLAVATSSGATPNLSELLSTLPEESRTHFFGLVEAVEIYQSTHGGSLKNLNEAAVSELRKLRDFCLQGGLHAYY